jgi:hypothetical protein
MAKVTPVGLFYFLTLTNFGIIIQVLFRKSSLAELNPLYRLDQKFVDMGNGWNNFQEILWRTGSHLIF